MLCTASEGTCLDWLKNLALLKLQVGSSCDEALAILSPAFLCVNVCVYAISPGKQSTIRKENMLIIAICISSSTAELYVFVKAVCRIRNESEALKLGIMRRQTGLLTEPQREL